MGSKIAIGDTLYRFDENYREFAKDEKGMPCGSALYPSHFRPFTIIGQTPKSWVLNTPGKESKVSKADLRESVRWGSGKRFYRWFTAIDMDDDIWKHEHRRKIVHMVERASADQLREIAKMLAYDPNA